MNKITLIVIKNLIMKQKSQNRKFMLMIFLSFMLAAASAQEINVTGNIKDVSGENLIGVSVKVKNSSKGTITNLDGNFELKARQKDILTISYVGYETQEVAVSEKQIKVVLKENSVSLEDVVVIGYGSVKKSDLTGSVATIKTDKLKSIPSNSIDGLLQGRSAGLQVISSSQDPGAGTTIRLRGGSSLVGSNSPLMVVDGFPMGDAGNMKQINPDDIESIEILKDASAASIYGSRGANGVIMITTKKAKQGKTIISIKNQLTASQFSSNLVRFKDPLIMMQLNNEGRINSGFKPLYIGEYSTNGVYYPSLQEVESGSWSTYTDWASIVFRPTPLLNNTSLSISNANEKRSLSLTGNFFTQQGAYIKDDYSKGIVNMNLINKLTDELTVTTMCNFAKDYRNNNTGLSYSRNPLFPVYTENGDYYSIGTQDYSHPLALTNTKLNKTQGIDIMASLGLDWQVLKTLSVRTQANYRYRFGITDLYYPKKYTSLGAANNGAAELDNNYSEDFSTDTYVTYKPVINKKQALSIMGGFSYEGYLGRSFQMMSYNFVNEALKNENMAAGSATMNTHTSSLSSTKLLSYMFRANYTFDDKYMATITGRADGSSKFGTNNKWGFFPSGALGWKLHNEDFIKDLNAFDEFKFRTSYGILGNQGISPYQTLSRFGVDNYFVNGEWKTAIGPGYVTARTGSDSRYTEWGGIPNNGLKWESTQQTNIGVDLAFFKRRLRLTLDYYDKHTFDLLRQSYLAPSSGFDKMWINDGEISNKGVEFTIDGDIIDTKDWKLSGTLIFSTNKNKVISLGNSQSAGLQTDPLTGMQYEYYGTTLDPFRQTSPNILAINQPVNVFYGYKTDGIVQTKAQGLASGMTGYEAEAGEFNFVDLSGDGVWNENDRTVIGDPNPDFTASLNLNLKYKNFDAGIFLNGVYGNDVIETDLYNSPQFTPLRWTIDNPTNSYPRLRENRLYYVSDWFIKDGSFLRIQNLNVGYTFVKPSVIKNSRVFVNIDNLYTFTKFRGYDPEVGLNGRYSGGYPRFRKITLGVELNF